MRDVRWYVAGVVATGLSFLCHLFNHVGGCWLSFGGPLKRLDAWAFDVLNPISETQWRTQNGHDRQSVAVEIIRAGEGYTEARLTFSPAYAPQSAVESPARSPLPENPQPDTENG